MIIKTLKFIFLLAAGCSSLYAELPKDLKAFEDELAGLPTINRLTELADCVNGNHFPLTSKKSTDDQLKDHNIILKYLAHVDLFDNTTLRKDVADALNKNLNLALHRSKLTQPQILLHREIMSTLILGKAPKGAEKGMQEAVDRKYGNKFKSIKSELQTQIEKIKAAAKQEKKRLEDEAAKLLRQTSLNDDKPPVELTIYLDQISAPEITKEEKISSLDKAFTIAKDLQNITVLISIAENYKMLDETDKSTEVLEDAFNKVQKANSMKHLKKKDINQIINLTSTFYKFLFAFRKQKPTMEAVTTYKDFIDKVDDYKGFKKKIIELNSYIRAIIKSLTNSNEFRKEVSRLFEKQGTSCLGQEVAKELDLDDLIYG